MLPSDFFFVFLAFMMPMQERLGNVYISEYTANLNVNFCAF